MDFAALPPEINSVRMYTGPGSASMLAAATAWSGLAADLRSTAASYGSWISELTDSDWSGPSSASMAAAAVPYATWMTSTAAQTEQAANQARAAAVAYETAFGMTVPPTVVAANRSLLAALIAMNILGQNAPAIAATESHYAEMWVQDATAMHNYAASAANAVQLTPFTAPAPTTTDQGLAAQAAAVTQAAANPSVAHAGTVMSAVPQLLHSLSAATSTTSPTTIASLLAEYAPYIGALSAGIGTGAGSIGLIDIFAGAASAAGAGAGSAASLLSTGGADVSQPALSRAASGTGVLASRIEPVSADLGRAGTVGSLSVPRSWPTGVPTPGHPELIPAVRLSAETIPTAMPPAMWSALPMTQPTTGRAPAPRFVPATQRNTASNSQPKKSAGEASGRSFFKGIFRSI